MEKLVVEDIKVEVAGKEVLKGVSISLGRGEVGVVMGPNGSGKSTLAYALAGHPGYTVKSGRIRVVGGKRQIDILSLKPDERARLGLFLGFQNPIAIPGLSVFNLLRVSREVRRGEDKEAISVVDFYSQVKGRARELGIGEEFLKRSINDGFSGGEKKKVEILQLLVSAPKFAILDEPDTGLDVDALKVIAQGINKCAKEGTGVLLITHYTRILKYLKSDKVYILKEGRVVRSGGYEVAKEVENRGYGAIT